MANETINELLYQRMAAEQARYRAWLREQPPDVILDHAYSYTIREDIMMEMEVLKLSDKQTKALLKSRTPLADVYREWRKAETNHMDDIRDVIESRAESVLRAEKERPQRGTR